MKIKKGCIICNREFLKNKYFKTCSSKCSKEYERKRDNFNNHKEWRRNYIKKYRKKHPPKYYKEYQKKYREEHKRIKITI